MENKLTTIFFIDHDTYNSLLNKDFNINNLIKLFTDTSDYKHVTNIVKAIIDESNRKIYKILFDSNYCVSETFFINNSLNNSEYKYVDFYVRDYLGINKTESVDSNKKYYEFITLINNIILVVYERFFITSITESKDKLLEFILDCLCHHYNFNLKLNLLMKSYINIKVNTPYLDVIKLRFN